MTKLNEQCELLRNYNATMKQKIHITKSVIQAGIAYGFYAVAFSLPTINKLDKIITRLHKSILGVPCSIPNVTTQLPYENFGLGAFSLHNAYLRCIREQLIDALNDPRKLGIIYQRLTKFITAKIGGVQHISRITKQSCVQSPITHMLYLLKKVVGAHIRSINKDLPLQRTQLEELWFTQCTNHPNITNKISLHFLNNLFLHHITNLCQLIRPNGNQLMNINEFTIHYGQPNKIIKNILKLAEKLFCHPTCEINCVQPCPHHQAPCTLLLQFHIPPHELPNHPQSNQAQNIIPPPPRAPPPHIWGQLKNLPPNNILKHHYHNKINIYGTTKQYNTYLCEWNYPPDLIYSKWKNQNSLFPQ